MPGYIIIPVIFGIELDACVAPLEFCNVIPVFCIGFDEGAVALQVGIIIPVLLCTGFGAEDAIIIFVVFCTGVNDDDVPLKSGMQIPTGFGMGVDTCVAPFQDCTVGSAMFWIGFNECAVPVKLCVVIPAPYGIRFNAAVAPLMFCTIAPIVFCTVFDAGAALPEVLVIGFDADIWPFEF